MQRRKTATALVTSFCLAFTVASVTAQETVAPEAAKDYRQTIMHALGAHASAISMHLRDLVGDHDFLGEHARSLANTAAELDHLFPAGSNVDDSEALPSIWEKPQEFARAVAKAKDATAALAEIASSGDRDAIGAAFREVGASCRGCHDNFREDDHH